MVAVRCGALCRLAVLAALCLASLSLLPSSAGQSYVPQVPEFTAANCGPNERFVPVGYRPSDALNATLFPDNKPDVTLGGYWSPFIPIYTYTTLFPNFTYGLTLYQISVALNDNSALLNPVSMRLGVYLMQTPEAGNVVDFDFASLLGMTDAITLYPSKAQTLFANLLKPVTLLAEGQYGLAIYVDSPIYIVGGKYESGYSGLPDLWYEFGGGFNDYQLWPVLEMYPGDQMRPVGAVGCIDKNAFSSPNTTTYAFCAMVETYAREPRGNGNNDIASITNTTRYSGVIQVSNTMATTANGGGYPIVFMEGEVQQTYNAGSYFYPPIDASAFPFRYSTNHSQYFPDATDLLYPFATNGIPIDAKGIVLTTTRNQTNLYLLSNANSDQMIGSTGQTGIISKIAFSSFIALPVSYLNQVITNCTIPYGYFYKPDPLSCPANSAYVAYGDVSLLDTDALEADEEYQFLPPNMLSFRYFKVFAPDASAYQLTYYTWANQEAIVHMRMGLFKTNTSYVDSFSAEPQFQLIAMAHEIELVNIDVGLVQANLSAIIPLDVGQLYAVGVWTDAIIYGPASQWGVDASGLPMPYTQIAQDGTMPQTAYALGGQTGVQLMGVNMCASNNTLKTINWCATFGEYRLTIFGWMLIKRYYNGAITVLDRLMYNNFGTYQIATAGNGTYSEVWRGPIPDPYTPPHPENLPIFEILNGTWNMNNFQVLSPNYLYVPTNSSSSLYLDDQGMQVIVNIQYEDFNEVYATIINAVRPRGSPEWFYQESAEFDYYDTYQQVANTNNKFLVTTDGSMPVCPVDYVPWNAVLPFGSQSFIVACTGLAQIQSTHGDNRIFDYVNSTEGNMIQPFILYTVNFTANATTLIQQVSLDVLNNLNITDRVSASFGLYAPNGSLIGTTGTVQLFELLDQMIVLNFQQPILLDVTGMYTVGVVMNRAFAVATSSMSGPVQVMTSYGLPQTFAPTTTAPLISITAYGCVTATHSFCASFQYYQGRDYSPITYDYLYQGLIRTMDVPVQKNDYGYFLPIEYAVGHLLLYARIAKYAFQFKLGWTDMLLSKPGMANGDQTLNVLYTQPINGQPLDNYGITFRSNDDYGAPFSIFYNTQRGRYQDSTNEQLGAELLTFVQLQPINFSIGVPRCSWLDLPSVVSPNTTADLSCGTGTSSVVWGDDINGDYFYSSEGMWNNDMNLIVLSPFNTGPGDYSTVSQLGLAINQNGNVFAHIKMALYDSNNMLLAEANEVTIDNTVDEVLIFTLKQSVLLTPASVYYAAYWSDVAFYTSATEDFSTARCYYNLTIGYDRQPWPFTVGSVEAEYYLCNALPVAAIGCTTPNITPPPVPPICPEPETEKAGYSMVTVVIVALLALALGVILSLLAVKLYNAGSCQRIGLGSGSSADSGPLSSRGDEAATTSSRYSSLADE